jgi:TolA-binding protein
MKKSIFTLAALSLFMTGTIFTSCNSAAQKEENTTTTEQQEAINDEQVVATAEEWQEFKTDAEAKIKRNEIRIEELTVQMNKPGQVFDDLYKNRILELEQQNKKLQDRIDAYDKSHTDWEKFKREFNHDMDELGDALKNITVNNKN